MDLSRVLSLWWEPGKTDRQYAGELSRDRGGAVTIQLIGTLADTPFPIHDPEPSVLHGLGNQGPLFTARRLIRTGARMGAPGFASEAFRPMSLIVGGHVAETTLYDRAVLQLTFLSDWLQQSGIRIEVIGAADDKRSAAVRYEWPATLTSRAAIGLTVSTWYAHQGTPTRSGYTINEDVALKVELDVGLSVDALIRDAVNPLVDLVSFATGRSNAIDRLTIGTPEITTTIDGNVRRDDLKFLAEWIVKTREPQPEKPRSLRPSSRRMQAAVAASRNRPMRRQSAFNQLATFKDWLSARSQRLGLSRRPTFKLLQQFLAGAPFACVNTKKRTSFG